MRRKDFRHPYYTETERTEMALKNQIVTARHVTENPKRHHINTVAVPRRNKLKYRPRTKEVAK